MKAFVVRVSELFRMDTGKNEEYNFAVNKRKLLIPLYQREYKWTDEKIISLVNDIERQDKFLGNVILDEANDCYEIVDGQQRITTCYLLLLSIFNRYVGHQREQESIKEFIKSNDNRFILQNDSVGDFVIEKDGLLQICVSEQNDVYYQKDDFERAFDTINNFVNSHQDLKNVHAIKQKLLECQLLVLLNNSHSHTRPVEQIFLDINEKAQLLEVEDIFKGHCFENYDENFYKELRDTWIELKKCGMGFKKFGFEDLSQYIYLYLLEEEGTSIPENLTTFGKHYLDGKTMDDTEELLLNMIGYGNDVISFYEKINQIDYCFGDMCENSIEYRNTDNHKILKILCKEMLVPPNTKAQYQKLPLMYFIHFLKSNESLKSTIKHVEFRKIITNLYIYMSLFILSGGRKSKKDIDRSINMALNKEPLSITEVVGAAKELRNVKINEFTFRDNYKFESLSFIYSVIDYYSSNDNWIKVIYKRETGYTLEHFIIPDNRYRKISWEASENKFDYYLPITVPSKCKNCAINFLILEKDLNEDIEDKDIVTKIEMIKSWYQRSQKFLPRHVDLIIKYILDMPQFDVLNNLRIKNAEKEEIKKSYEDFIITFFSEDSVQQLSEKLQKEFRNAFSNRSS